MPTPHATVALRKYCKFLLPGAFVVHCDTKLGPLDYRVVIMNCSPHGDIRAGSLLERFLSQTIRKESLRTIT